MSRSLSGVLGAVCALIAGTYGLVVASALTSTPNYPQPGDLEAMAPISAESGPVGELYIRVSGADEEDSSQFLACTGDPDADPEACAVLDERVDALDEVAEDTICTDTLYGPEAALISGNWDGDEVLTELTRDGSCEEARWQRLSFLTELAG
ncbi:hypothetical protein J4H86_08490 [Spiractinospora alimapuensis]|uniref:hypothetical protein n=1 Tax=Spiractinospora alimapuensis TaxID=2820884 RepID=UPI001F1C5645|nr:hypothetical protein [Spiractinospora alimapuensis]QVQ53741.1 hypothetical protein J4H86_08490 [Spiractinospora alimapuensis]